MTVRVYDNCYTSRNGSPTDASDECGVMNVPANANCVVFTGVTFVADIDIETPGRNVGTGTKAQCDVGVAGAVNERVLSDSRVVEERLVVPEGFVSNGHVTGASGVLQHRSSTNRRVVGAVCVAKERLKTDRLVLEAVYVFIERLETHGRAATASEVVRKCSLSQRHVEAARGVEDKGIFTYRRVVAAVIVQQCLSTQGCVVSASGVRLERFSAES